MPVHKDSKWFATPQVSRKRKHVTFTLSDEARECIQKLVQEIKLPASAIVEGIILDEAKRRGLR